MVLPRRKPPGQDDTQTDGSCRISGRFGTSAGATKWQTVEAPVDALQTFGLRLTIYDVGDTTLDSTALFDGFEWLLEPAQQVSLFSDGFEGN